MSPAFELREATNAAAGDSEHPRCEVTTRHDAKPGEHFRNLTLPNRGPLARVDAGTSFEPNVFLHRLEAYATPALALDAMSVAKRDVVFCSRPVFARHAGTDMQGSLGEKIGEGVFADVHAWGAGQVVKLSKPGLPPWVLQHEARMTRAVFAAGGPAPEVLDEVTLDGRFGLVLPRFDGPTLRQAVRTGAITSEQAGAILATLCLAVHQTRPPSGALSLREAMDARLRFAGGVLPERIIAGVFARIEHVEAEDVLCHADLHPGNVIMTAQGPKLIDWLGAARAPAAYEMAQCQVLIAELDPEHCDEPERAPVNSALQLEYARLARLAPEALTAAIQPYLPLVRVFLLLGGAKPEMRERLLQRVEAALRSEP